MQKLELNITESYILKKYEGDKLFEVLLLDQDGQITEKITDEERLHAFN